jgi:hypothetical protein
LRGPPKRIALPRGEEECADTLLGRQTTTNKEPRSAIRAHDVRAAGLQEEPTKRVDRANSPEIAVFVGFDEDGGYRRTSQRAERAIRESERSEWSNRT